LPIRFREQEAIEIVLYIFKNNPMKKFLKILLYTIGILLSIALILAIILWIKSPGTTDSITGKDGKPLPGSISRIEKTKLGGIDQYLVIRAADSTKPVMLFLHGGPGSPEIAFMQETNSGLEKDFVMVYWEQRGAGKSYSKDIPAETMNIKHFVSDTHELSQILIKRFKKEKIYLMGHSWGSILGILTAHQYPELYYAYFGIGQVCDQYKSEKISLEWLKEQSKNANDNKALKDLSALNYPELGANIEDWEKYLMTERQYVNEFGGGTTRQMKGMWPLVKMVLNAKEYTLKEKMDFMSGSLFSLRTMWLEIINKNLFNDIDSMKIPVYLFHGKSDYTVTYSVSKEFFEQLKAPEKEFYTFENSAHSPCMEEPEKFNQIVRGKTIIIE
jgi:pimeloyl-ACP methyl ester carboxylesterase